MSFFCRNCFLMESNHTACRRLSDDCLAWNMTHHACHAHLPKRISQKARAMPVDSLPSHEQSLVGPQALRYDHVSMIRWTLISHGGYSTYPHKDANGLCTWIFAHVGIKIWAILEPKYLSPHHNKRAAQFKLHTQMMGAPFNWQYEEASDMYTVFLAPGDMLYESSFMIYSNAVLTSCVVASCLPEHGMLSTQQLPASRAVDIFSCMTRCI